MSSSSRDRSNSYDESYLYRNNDNNKKQPSRSSAVVGVGDLKLIGSTTNSSIPGTAQASVTSTSSSSGSHHHPQQLHMAQHQPLPSAAGTSNTLSLTPVYRSNFGKTNSYNVPSFHDNHWNGAHAVYSATPSRAVMPKKKVVYNDSLPLDEEVDHSQESDDDEPFDSRPEKEIAPRTSPTLPAPVQMQVDMVPPPSLVKQEADPNLPFDESVGEDLEPPSLTKKKQEPWSRVHIPSTPPPAAVAASQTFSSGEHEDSQRLPTEKFRLAPPRVSTPLVLQYSGAAGERHSPSRPKDAPISKSQPAAIRAIMSATRQSPDVAIQQQQSQSSSSSPKNITPTSPDENGYEEFHILNRAVRTRLDSVEAVGDEEDSLFDFDDYEKHRRRKKMNDRRTTTRRSQEIVDPSEYDDDTSIEASPTSLSERAQVAWKRKQARSGKSARSPPSPRISSSAGVSFGEHDVVHHFARDPTEDTLDSATFAGRSLNSEYTKSAESEVEDFLKDIFLWGSSQGKNPGRRKIKYNPQVKKQLKSQDADVDVDESLETFEENEDPLAASVPLRSTSKTSVSASTGTSPYTDSVSCEDIVPDEKVDDDPFATAWNIMEGGITAITAVLGIDKTKTNPARSVLQSCDVPPVLTSETPIPQELVQTSAFMDYASEVFGPNVSDQSDASVAQDLPEKPQVSLEEDIRLVHLATQAAKSMHRLKGYSFDEACDINIVGDIKFNVVDMESPFGLIFQENDVGCWITKVIPGGKAARMGTIQVGDQLAAIDGMSAINLKVHEIAQAVEEKDGRVELTFLRYIGPFRPAPGPVSEEGYEVNVCEKSTVSMLSTETLSRSQTNTQPRISASQKSQKQETGGPKTLTKTAMLPTASTSQIKSVARSQKNEEVGPKRRFRFFGRKK